MHFYVLFKGPDESDLSEETGGISHKRKSTSKVMTRVSFSKKILIDYCKKIMTFINWNNFQLYIFKFEANLLY